MRSRRVWAGVLALGAALAVVLTLTRQRSAELAPAPIARAPSVAARPPAPPPRATASEEPAPALASGAPRGAGPPERNAPASTAARASAEVDRARFVAALASVLSDELPARDVERLADLALEARDLRGRESPAREREILVALSEEFERVAGAPMGDVISRLPRAGDLSPRPVSDPPAAPETSP